MASDTLIVIYIFVVLIITNVLAGLLTAEFGNSSSTNTLNEEELEQGIDDLQAESGWLTTLKVFSGVFAWSFGLLPAWLDMYLLMLRAVGYFILAKIIRGVGS